MPKSKKEKIVKEKKALSGIVLVVLFILVGTVAAVILWNIVLYFSSEHAEAVETRIELSNQKFDIKKATRTNPENPLEISVIVSQLSGKQKAVDEEIVQATQSLPVDLVSVADLSGSMNANLSGSYAPPSKLEYLLNATRYFINDFINKTEKGRVGLVGFAHYVNSSAVTGFSRDNTSLIKFMKQQWSPYGGTCICCGIIEGRNMLMQSASDTFKVMIVMSDGRSDYKCSEQGVVGNLNNNSFPDDPSDHAIQAACNANINLNNLTIYSIGFGNDTDVDKNTLQKIATCGNGQYYDASNANDFLKAYGDISEIVQTKFQIFQKASYLVFVFKDLQGNSYSKKEYELPTAVFESKEYIFDLNGQNAISYVKEINIYAGATLSNGKEEIGNLLDFIVIN